MRALALFASHTLAWGQAAPEPGPLPGARAAGRGRLRFWGLDVYDAALWVTPGFRQSAFAFHAFVLELDYLRAFSGADIARRSITEMRRTGGFSEQQAAQWQAALGKLLPDVRPGDRITGIHQPGQGAAFAFNGKRLGEIRDAQFSSLFFGIWLSPNTSEPGLREALLAGAPA